MADQDLLALARSALALGDWFVPPVGTFLHIRGYQGTFRAKSAAIYEGPKILEGGRLVFSAIPSADVPKRYNIRALFIFQGDFFEIVRLPARCTPFEQWERPAQ